MSSLYQAELLDHYRNPRNRGELAQADFTSMLYNPSCGDKVQFQGVVTHGLLEAIAFTGVGCVISQATASLLGQRVLGYCPAQVIALDKKFIIELIGMELGPTRLKCALLPLEALQQGISDCAVKNQAMQAMGLGAEVADAALAKGRRSPGDTNA